MNRLAQNVAFTAGLMTLLAFHGSARADQAQNRPSPSLQQSPAGQAKPNAYEDYFAGLDYTAEQKASIDKVKQDTEAKKAVVAKDDKLDAYQKDAFVQGYTRLEYQQIFKLLTPTQQKLVRQRMDAAKAAANKGPKRPAPAPPRQ